MGVGQIWGQVKRGVLAKTGVRIFDAEESQARETDRQLKAAQMNVQNLRAAETPDLLAISTAQQKVSKAATDHVLALMALPENTPNLEARLENAREVNRLAETQAIVDKLRAENAPDHNQIAVEQKNVVTKAQEHATGVQTREPQNHAAIAHAQGVVVEAAEAHVNSLEQLAKKNNQEINNQEILNAHKVWVAAAEAHLETLQKYPKNTNNLKDMITCGKDIVNKAVTALQKAGITETPKTPETPEPTGTTGTTGTTRNDSDNKSSADDSDQELDLISKRAQEALKAFNSGHYSSACEKLNSMKAQIGSNELLTDTFNNALGKVSLLAEIGETFIPGQINSIKEQATRSIKLFIQSIEKPNDINHELTEADKESKILLTVLEAKMKQENDAIEKKITEKSITSKEATEIVDRVSKVLSSFNKEALKQYYPDVLKQYDAATAALAKAQSALTSTESSETKAPKPTEGKKTDAEQRLAFYMNEFGIIPAPHGNTLNDYNTVMQYLIKKGTQNPGDGTNALLFQKDYLEATKDINFVTEEEKKQYKEIKSALETSELSHKIAMLMHGSQNESLSETQRTDCSSAIKPAIDDLKKHMLNKIQNPEKQPMLLYYGDGNHFTSLFITQNDDGSFKCTYHDPRKEKATTFEMEKGKLISILENIHANNKDNFSKPETWRDELTAAAQKNNSQIKTSEIEHLQQEQNACHSMALIAPIYAEYTNYLKYVDLPKKQEEPEKPELEPEPQPEPKKPSNQQPEPKHSWWSSWT